MILRRWCCRSLRNENDGRTDASTSYGLRADRRGARSASVAGIQRSIRSTNARGVVCQNAAKRATRIEARMAAVGAPMPQNVRALQQRARCRDHRSVGNGETRPWRGEHVEIPQCLASVPAATTRDSRASGGAPYAPEPPARLNFQAVIDDANGRMRVRGRREAVDSRRRSPTHWQLQAPSCWAASPRYSVALALRIPAR